MAVSDRVVFGIDHTAITVRRAEASRAFYARLGFIETHRQTNRGVEQARLDGLRDLSGAEVQVVSLSNSEGDRPGIELLEYVAPQTFARAAEDSSCAATCAALAADRNEALRDPDGHRVLLEIGKPP